MDESLIVDRLDRIVDRLDRMSDRFDRVVDRQNIHTRTLREIITMTQANNQDVQGLVQAVQDLTTEVTDGLGAVDSRFSELQSTIDSLTSLNDQERQALQDATASVRSQISTVSQSFSRFKADPATPVDPAPVPDPGEGTSPVGPVSPADPGAEPTPGSSTPDDGSLNFGN